jgi:putative transposase
MATEEQKAASAQRRAKNRARGEARPHPRVRARPTVAGTRVKVTRRCMDRRLFLATGADPDKVRNDFGYILGRSLEIYGLELHAAIQMGNHQHTDATDVRGVLPDFKCSFHANIAKHFNAPRARFSQFWEKGSSCDTCQLSDEATLQGIVYDETNPVKAGLVKWADQWPGFTTAGWKFGETRTFKRPPGYFDPKNPTNPDEVTITRVRPKIYMELSDDELFELIETKVRERCIEIQAEMRSKGRRFKGLDKLRKERWDRAPTSWEERFGTKPKVTEPCKWRRLAALERDRAWELEYAEARAAMQRGEKAIFPHGTWLLRVRYNVRVAQPQAPP